MVGLFSPESQGQAFDSPSTDSPTASTSTTTVSSSTSPESGFLAGTMPAKKPRRKEKPRSERIPRAKPCTSCRVRKTKCRPFTEEQQEAGAIGCSLAPLGVVAPPIALKEGFKTRKGSNIGKLQKSAEVQVQLANVNIAATSSSARLANVELGSALSWSLMTLAFEETTVKGLAPISSLQVVANDFRANGMRIYELPIEQEGIVGTPNPHLPLGPRRESACRNLAQRAVDLFKSAPDISNRPSKNHLELVTAVKEMLIQVHPDHPFALEITQILIDQRTGILAQGLTFSLDEEVRTGFALYDARVSARAGVEPTLDEDELDGQAAFFIGAEFSQEALIGLSQPDSHNPDSTTLSGWILTTQYNFLRRVTKILPLAYYSPSQALSAFLRLRDIVDVGANFLQAKLAATGKHDNHLAFDLMGQVPDVVLCECHLMSIAQRAVTFGEEWVEVADQERKRFLVALKWLGGIMDSPQFLSYADAHWVARRLQMLELVEGWVDIALAGAAEPNSPINYDDVIHLLHAVGNAGSVFASCAIRAGQLIGGLRRARQAPNLRFCFDKHRRTGADACTPLQEMAMRETEEEEQKANEVAEKMVDDVMRDLGFL
ncbi:C6 transcription factor [Pseudohyphozyma bogoriensis]|nr:C6 transcription factor [Pseudohyphozyma bogoriensis]